MLSADPLGSRSGDALAIPESGGQVAEGASQPVIVLRIARTEEQQSMMMQKFTAYVVQVTDFGRQYEVHRRYSDFASMHQSLLQACPSLPGMPPKGLDGSDPQVVKARKHDLEQLLTSLMRIPEVLMDKELHFWKFLELQNPSVICGRFVMVPRSREMGIRTVAKLVDPKYADDVWRVWHPAIVDIVLQMLAQIRDSGGNNPNLRSCCALLNMALQRSESARKRILDAGGIGLLLGVVEKNEQTLDEVRGVLNIVIAREGDKFCDRLADFLDKGGLGQLQNLCRGAAKISEFVAKLLWLAWDAPMRTRMASGGMGLLGTLLGLPATSCRLLGTALLAGLVSHGHITGPQRQEALRHCRAGIAQPVRADEIDQAFVKALCGTATTIGRIAALMEDPETAGIALGMIVRVKPPAASLTRIAGNLASVVGNMGGVTYSEEARARAAELLLLIDTSDEAKSQPFDLERCQGLAQYEESLELAITLQLRETVATRTVAMEQSNGHVTQNSAVVRSRMQPLPLAHDFHKEFEGALGQFNTARELMQECSQASQTLLHSMNGKLTELSRGPQISEDAMYKDRLVKAEQAWAEVKERRDALGLQEQAMKASASKAQQFTEQLKAADEAVFKLQKDMDELTRAKMEKENEASKLRHRAATPNIDSMKEGVKQQLEQCESKLRQLQTAAQRVQQGDPDYLKDGESRDSKMQSLQQQNQQLRRQHQQLQQQLKEYDFDPVDLMTQAEKLDNESREKQLALLELQGSRSEAERDRDIKRIDSQRELEQARSDKMQFETLSTQVKLLEDSLRTQMASLQPQMRDRHCKLQRELKVKDELDGDQVTLNQKIEETSASAQKESLQRNQVRQKIAELVSSLQRLDQTLVQIESSSSEAGAVSVGTGLLSSAPAAEASAFDAGALMAQPAASAPAANFRTPSNVFDDLDDGAPQLTPAPVAVPSHVQADLSRRTASVFGEESSSMFDEDPAPPRAADGQPAQMATCFAEEPPQLVQAPQAPAAPSDALQKEADEFDDFLNDTNAPAPTQTASAPAPAGDAFDF